MASTATYRTKPQYDLIWKHTHRDFKGKIDGVRYILVFRNGTQSVALENLTDAEFDDALGYARRKAEGFNR
jgi:hypothetical protein